MKTILLPGFQTSLGYMFTSQWFAYEKIIHSGNAGEVRCYRGHCRGLRKAAVVARTAITARQTGFDRSNSLTGLELLFYLIMLTSN